MFRAIGDDGLIFTQPLQARDDQPSPGSPGAAAPTAAQIEALFQMAVAAGCTQLLPTDSGSPCLDTNWIMAVGACKFGLPAPAGVSPSTWTAFCNKSASCGWENFPGCASYDTQVGASVPACADDKFLTGVSYCDAHPFSDGPDKMLNALCWAAGKSPTFMYNAHAVPACPGAAKAGMSPGLKWGLIGAAVLGVGYMLTRRR